jgi:hypothetical protein
VEAVRAEARQLLLLPIAKKEVSAKRKAQKAASVRRWRKRHPERARACETAWRKANPERVKTNQRGRRLRWRERHLEKARAIGRRWYEENKDKSEAARLKRLYGISGDAFGVMLKAQGYACAICRRPFSRETHTTKPQVDHDHASGCTRGLLCRLCNTLLGHALESPQVLRAAAAYIIRYREKT